MIDPLATLIVAQGVLVLSCFLIGFLVGIAIWKERDSRRRRAKNRSSRVRLDAVGRVGKGPYC